MDDGFAFSEAEGIFGGFGDAGAVAGRDLDPILDNEDFGREFFELGRGIGADDFAIQKNAEIGLRVEEGEEFFGSGVPGNGDGKEDEDGVIGEVFFAPSEDGVWRIWLDWLTGGGVIAGRETGVEELEVVVDLGEGADSRAGSGQCVVFVDGVGGV